MWLIKGSKYIFFRLQVCSLYQPLKGTGELTDVNVRYIIGSVYGDIAVECDSHSDLIAWLNISYPLGRKKKRLLVVVTVFETVTYSFRMKRCSAQSVSFPIACN